MAKKIRTHTDLDVYCKAFGISMQLFHLSKKFPKEERYSLTDQIRRSSRSVCANIAEAWRKRRYAAAFASKLNDAEAEGAETQGWTPSPLMSSPAHPITPPITSPSTSVSPRSIPLWTSVSRLWS